MFISQGEQVIRKVTSLTWQLLLVFGENGYNSQSSPWHISYDIRLAGPQGFCATSELMLSPNMFLNPVVIECRGRNDSRSHRIQSSLTDVKELTGDKEHTGVHTRHFRLRSDMHDPFLETYAPSIYRDRCTFYLQRPSQSAKIIGHFL